MQVAQKLGIRMAVSLLEAGRYFVLWPVDADGVTPLLLQPSASGLSQAGDKDAPSTVTDNQGSDREGSANAQHTIDSASSTQGSNSNSSADSSGSREKGEVSDDRASTSNSCSSSSVDGNTANEGRSGDRGSIDEALSIGNSASSSEVEAASSSSRLGRHPQDGNSVSSNSSDSRSRNNSRSSSSAGTGSSSSSTPQGCVIDPYGSGSLLDVTEVGVAVWSFPAVLTMQLSLFWLPGHLKYKTHMRVTA